MKKDFVLYLLILSLFFNFAITAQSLSSLKRQSLPKGLGISNQLEYSYDVENKREIFEDWFRLDYRNGIFSAGLRYDSFLPNDPDPSISRGKDRYSDIAFKYFQFDLGNAREGLKLTAGNYYELFGRGLILKSYEDRNIRIDNNMQGVRIIGRYAKFILKGLTGSMANENDERKDILHAADLEYKGLKKIKMGISAATNIPDVEGVAQTTLLSARIQPSIWNFDFYGEYGVKQNEDIKNETFKGEESIVGQAFYGGANFYLGSMALNGEYKYYDNYLFSSHDGTIIYNNPPSVRNEYSYFLPNRHPSPMDQNNEQGFLVSAIYNFDEESLISALYGETKTLNTDSYYQRILGTENEIRTQFREFFLNGTYKVNESFKINAAFAYNEELGSDTKNYIPIIEGYYYFGNVNTIKVAWEHQQTQNRSTDEKSYDDVLILEYLRSPKFSVSLVSELTTKEPEAGNVIRKLWSFISFGYKLGDHTDLNLLMGTRQAGNICIGGVCRYEPEFRGVELKMKTRLY